MDRDAREAERLWRPWPAASRFVGDSETVIFVISDQQVDAAARTPGAWERLDTLVREHGVRALASV